VRLTVLIFGHSGFAGRFGAPEERISVQLGHILQEMMSERAIDVQARLWNALSNDLIDALIDDIESNRPDYLVLAPSQFWVTYPTLHHAVRRRFNVERRPWLKKLLQLDQAVTQRFENSHPRILRLYKAPLALLRNATLGASPRFTPNEALEILDRIILAAIRHESTQVLLVGGDSLEAYLDYMAGRDRRQFQTLLPPENLPLLEQFLIGVRELAKSRHVPLIDHWRIPVVDLMKDGFHTGPQTKRTEAKAIAEAIIQHELAYGPPLPAGQVNARIEPKSESPIRTGGA
jgi:hypothetical protein